MGDLDLVGSIPFERGLISSQGLAISRHIIELHGGTISAHSEGTGKGTTFFVQFPLARKTDLPLSCSNTETTRLRRYFRYCVKTKLLTGSTKAPHQPLL